MTIQRYGEEDRRRRKAYRPDEAAERDLAAWHRPADEEPAEFTNPDTAGWVPVPVSPEDVARPSAYDAGHLLDAPSGRHGFLHATAKGRFEFEDGTPVRFLGGQADVFRDHDFASYHVQWLRRHGMNLVRAHGFGLPDPERWERLDFFISECKKGGVYLWLTPIYSTEVTVVDPNGRTVTVDNERICFFSRNVEAACREIWRTFFLHENPYTGLRYCDDPSISMTELKNEDSAFWALEITERAQPIFYADILRQFSEWLGAKYGSTGALRAAWSDDGREGSALEEAESIEAGNVRLLPMQEWWRYTSPEQQFPKQRKSDQLEFLHGAQQGFYRRSYGYLREIGVRQALCGSNWRGKGFSWRLVTQCDSEMDFVDQHDYWDHPSGGWTVRDATFHNRSMMRSSHGGLVGNLAPRRVLHKPYAVSEWNIGAWNEHVQEAPFLMVPYGRMQGWDALVQFVMVPEAAHRGVSRMGDRFFDVSSNPAVRLQYPTLSRLWHRGDVREAAPVVTKRIAPEQYYVPRPLDTPLTPYAYMFTTGEPEPEPNTLGQMAAAVGKLAIEFVDRPQPHYCHPDVAGYMPRGDMTVCSMTEELLWDYGHGFCIIDTPMTQGVCGYVGGLGFETAQAAFEPTTGYCTILVTSLDDERPIAESDRILVTALGRARNTGAVYGRPTPAHKGNGTVAVLAQGEAPVLVEPVLGRMALAVRDPETMSVRLLDPAGKPGEAVAGDVAQGALVLLLPGEHKSLFYLLSRLPQP
jgi:hypothetical protein